MSEKRLVPISIDRILVALDGSEHSKKAAKLAVDLAKMWDAELFLVHLLEEKKAPKGFEEYAKAEKVPADYFGMVCQRDQFAGEAETLAKEAG